MAAGLKLAPGLNLDPDYYGGGTFALLAKKGWGKTYAARVIAEELVKTRVPFVALDPMDAFWGLRAAADGSRGGLEVPIFGGPHGDAPLEASAGALMADLLIEEGISMVLSMKHFGSRSAERTFAKAFLDRLYRKNEDLVHILMDEADLFAPQKPQAGDQPLLGTTENIVRRGRNNGIGITMLTQRSAVLNKDVLTQVDGIIVGRMLGPNDRNAIDSWVGEHGDTHKGREIKDELPGLGTGECWVWVPEQGVLKKVTIREARTFDSSPTRKRKGTGRKEPKKLADIDLGAIEAKMAATIEKAKSEDPAELRKEVARLKRELEKKPDAAAAPEPVEVEVPVFPEKLRQELLDGLKRHGTDLAVTSRGLANFAEKIQGYDSPGPPARTPRRPKAAPSPRPASPPRAAEQQPTADPGDIALEPAEQKLIDALGWWEQVGVVQPPKHRVAFIGGYKAGKKLSGRLTNLFGALRTKGCVEYPTPGTVTLTPEGRSLAQPVDIEPTTEGVQQAILAKLEPAEIRLLQPAIDCYPEAIRKTEAAEMADYSIGESGKLSGRLTNLFGALRSLGLIDYPAPGEVVAMPVLFLEGS